MSEVDWKTILAQFVAALVPALIKAILDWLKNASAEEAVAMATKAGKAFNAFKTA